MVSEATMLPSPMGTEPQEPTTAPECSDHGLLFVLVAVGLLPFLVMLLTGEWSERELALGVMMLLAALAGVLGSRKQRE